MDKYISKYSNGKEVTAAQYITELICENKAKKDGKDLHYRFWTTNYWEKFYRNQIASANKLLEKYEAKPIIAAIRSTQGQKIFSLRAPFLVPIIDQMAIKQKSENKILHKELDRTDKTVFREHKPSKNIISKLKELE
jgi:hypothetical protein